MKAIITRSSKREFECYIPETEQQVLANALASVMKDFHPVVGDVVTLDKIGTHDWQISQIQERRSEISRRNVREYGKKRVIAANVDLMLVVMAVSKPEYKSGLVDRYLVRAKNWDVPVMVLFNKMDEFEDQFDLSFEKKRLEYLNIPYAEISAHSPKDFQEGHLEMQKALQDKTAIFVGQSGVGKSKIITQLSGGTADLKSSRLAKVGKGAHTTTWAELVRFKDFNLIDSPGIRSLALKDIDSNILDMGFEDIFNLFTQCQFKDCPHKENSKGCYFHNINDDTIEGQIILSRLDSYTKIRDELEEIPNWKKKGLRS